VVLLSRAPRPAAPGCYSLSLHDALPISAQALLVLGQALGMGAAQAHVEIVESLGLLAQAFTGVAQPPADAVQAQPLAGQAALHRSEEHTSELQSRENLVCRLLLEKKNKL